MSDRPTPETNDIAKGNHVVPVEWAQQLERERDEAREDLEFRRELYKVQDKYLEDARRERDEARRKLNNLDVTAIHSCHNECQRPICVLRRERDGAREALKRIYQASIVAQSLKEDFAEWEKAIEMLLDLLKKEAH